MFDIMEMPLSTYLHSAPEILEVPNMVVQKKRHRSKRINKKWKKRYGYIVDSRVLSLNDGKTLIMHPSTAKALRTLYPFF